MAIYGRVHDRVYIHSHSLFNMCISVIVRNRLVIDNPTGEIVGTEEIVTTAQCGKKKNTRFSAGHDVLLQREVIARNPYTAAAGEVTKTWAAIAASLNAAEATFNIDGRRCRDRTTLLLDYFRKDDTASLRRFVLQKQIHVCNLQRFTLDGFEPFISLTLCPSYSYIQVIFSVQYRPYFFYSLGKHLLASVLSPCTVFFCCLSWVYLCVLKN